MKLLRCIDNNWHLNKNNGKTVELILGKTYICTEEEGDFYILHNLPSSVGGWVKARFKEEAEISNSQITKILYGSS